MEDSNISIIRQTVKGVIAIISRTFILDIIFAATSIIVFSVLTQAQVGIYTVVVALQRIVSFFTDFGFGAALVQKKEELTREDLRTSFTLQALLTFSVFCVVLLLRGSIMSFSHLSPAGFRLLAVLIFTIFLSSFKTVPSILLERKIHFHKLVIPQLVETIVFNVILLLLVLDHFGVDSYSWAFLISATISIPFYFLAAPWDFGIGISKASLVHLKFGVQFQAKNILSTIKDDFLTVILTRFLNYSQIGYIGFAQSLAFYPYRYFVDSVTRVTFSAYARLQEDTKVLRGAIEKSLFFVSLLMFPVLTGIILAMPSIIMYFPKWHGKWEGALVSLTFFSLNAMVSGLSGILVNVLDSSGRVKTTLRLMVIWTVLTWTFTILAIYFYGYNGVAAASFFVTLTIYYTIYLVRKVIDFSFWKSIYKPIIGTVIMGIVFVLLKILFVHDLLSVFVVSFVSGVVYFITLYLFSGKELIYDIKILLKR